MSILFIIIGTILFMVIALLVVFKLTPDKSREEYDHFMDDDSNHIYYDRKYIKSHKQE